MKWLKKNWVSALLSAIAAISGADLATGIAGGKSILNLSNIPAIAFGGSSAAALAMRWINTRTFTTRVAPVGLNEETIRMMESIFAVAESADMTEEMIVSLSKIASAAVIGHAARVRAARESAAE